jgi:hypothetical protein
VRSRKMRELWSKWSTILHLHNRALKTGDTDLMLEWQEKYKKMQLAVIVIKSLQRLPASKRSPKECYNAAQKMGEYAEYLESLYLKKAKEYERELAQIELELEDIVI